MSEQKKIVVRLPQEMAHQLKVEAAKGGTTIQQIVTDAVYQALLNLSKAQALHMDAHGEQDDGLLKAQRDLHMALHSARDVPAVKVGELSPAELAYMEMLEKANKVAEQQIAEYKAKQAAKQQGGTL